LTAGDFFGEMSLLTGDKRYATIKAKERSRAIEIDRQAFKVLLQRERKIIEKVKHAIEERMKADKSKKTSELKEKMTEGGLFEKFKKIFGIRL
jgi:CRP-like cAMP-binding protein